jgi:hypothetical protein
VTEKMDFKKFIEERNGVLLRLDEEEVFAYCKRWGAHVPEDKTVFWAGVHKARLHIKDFPETERERSRRWLAEHGYSEDYE